MLDPDASPGPGFVRTARSYRFLLGRGKNSVIDVLMDEFLVVWRA
jgi:hypothetical protein